MATTKKAAKKTTKRTAGKAKREVFKVARTGRILAEGIQARETRTPGYWLEVQKYMNAWQDIQARTAQDMPREARTAH